MTNPNIWNYKPWWCQPWSILLTGLGLISGSWLLLRSIWITVFVAIPVLIWMGFFLVVYPKAMAQNLKQETTIRQETTIEQ